MQFLIVNAGCTHFGHGGTLSAAMVDKARETLEKLGHTVEETRLENGWDNAEEAQKILRADVVIIQTPGWWMSTPWQLKKYGSGGKLTSKRYLLSSTWNAPLEAFTDPNQFFEGKGIDGLFMPLHKTFEFLGMKPCESFMVNDVFKHPTIEADMKRWEAHLTKLFG